MVIEFFLFVFNAVSQTLLGSSNIEYQSSIVLIFRNLLESKCQWHDTIMLENEKKSWHLLDNPSEMLNWVKSFDFYVSVNESK